jgi:hypothetical protein
MVGLGIAGNILLWKSGLYGYTADPGMSASSLGFLQWLSALAGLLQAALVLSSIEVFGRRRAPGISWFLFWTALLWSVGFGVISATKAGPLQPLVVTCFIYVITKGRIPKAAFLLPVFLVVMVYPFVNAFRENLNAGYRAQINTLGGLGDSLRKSFGDAFLSFGSTSGATANRNLTTATARLSYLDHVRNMLNLPAPSMLSGDEKVWLAPFYPLVPRFIWKDKPVLNKGVRLAYLLGSPGNTSAAITPVADLYVMYGRWGLVIGMLVWGTSLQLATNWITRRNISERGLFVYTLMAPVVLNLESDVVGFIVATVQYGILNVFLAYVSYAGSEIKDTRRFHGRTVTAVSRESRIGEP